MSMNPESESEQFEQLRRVLVLKRHEQPPPGYFHNFSREVIVRIKAGELGEDTITAWWVWEGSWIQKLWGAFEARPVLAGAFGVAVCGFFVAGAMISTDTVSASAESQPGAPAVVASQAAGMPLWDRNAQVETSTQTASPSIQPAAAGSSLFQAFDATGAGRLSLQPASFSPATAPAGGN
jgi:hypothetical protein